MLDVIVQQLSVSQFSKYVRVRLQIFKYLASAEECIRIGTSLMPVTDLLPLNSLRRASVRATP